MFSSSGSPTDEDATISKESSYSHIRPEDCISHEKIRRMSGLGGKASSLLASAKISLHFNQHSNSRGSIGQISPTLPFQELGKQDSALSVPQGQYNNSAGESLPGPRSTFSVGVWEDRNKKCRRTMEDTHAFLYNFLHTPAPALNLELETGLHDKDVSEKTSVAETKSSPAEIMETDNGYFAIFDGHAGTFAADWCGKKLHLILEDLIRKNHNSPIPELLDQTFTSVDVQLEKLPLKNSGCTAVTAVLRWEDRIPNSNSAIGSTAIAPASVVALELSDQADAKQSPAGATSVIKTGTSEAIRKSIALEESHARLKSTAIRQRILYTANVGDARIVLCRKGKALRLSYDHKGSDENEGRRIISAGGLIVNNRVNGVLAVTRALGDNYMKDLVTGHPYTTETVIQSDIDEFLILACDGLWDVCSDQDAVNLIREINDPNIAAKKLVDHALARFSTDNLSCMIVRFNPPSTYTSKEPIGVEGDPSHAPRRMSEAEKLVENARKRVEAGVAPGFGVSGSNFGKGHDLKMMETKEENRIIFNIGDSKSSEIRGHRPYPDDESTSPTSIKPSLQLPKKNNSSPVRNLLG